MRSLTLSKKLVSSIQTVESHIIGIVEKKRHGSCFCQQYFAAVSENLCWDARSNRKPRGLLYLVIENFEQNVQEIETIANIL